MRADPKKHYVPTAADAARWFALAEVAMQVSTGASKAWHELERLAMACLKSTVFGRLHPENPCWRLRAVAWEAAQSLRPYTYATRLKAAAQAVKEAYYDWEAGQ